MTDTQAAATAPGASPEPSMKMRREVLVVLPGLLLAIMLAMLDQLIVGTALPRIVGSLGGVAHLVLGGHRLRARIDHHHPALREARRHVRPEEAVHGGDRAVPGRVGGCAGLSPVDGRADLVPRHSRGSARAASWCSAIAIIGDLVSPRERGQLHGLHHGRDDARHHRRAAARRRVITDTLLLALDLLHQPADRRSWPWPYLAATLHLPRRRVEHRVDYPGALVARGGHHRDRARLDLGGSQYAWASPRILGSGCWWPWWPLAAVPHRSRARAAEPILPLHVFRNRNFALVTGLSFLAGLAMFGAITFLPLYQQTVQGASPTISGLLLIADDGGRDRSLSLIAGQITTRTGRYKALPIIGAGVMTAGMWLLSPARGGHQPGHLRPVHGGARPRHGFPHADYHAGRAEQRGAPRHRRGQQLTARSSSRSAGRSGSSVVRRHLRPAR